MVTVLLASLLVGGLFYMMSGQQTTYGQQINNTLSQQTLSGTMSFLQRAIRSAGYGFGACPGGRAEMKDPSDPSRTIPSPVVALRVHNDCNLLQTKPESCPDGSGADSMTVTAVHPEKLATANMPSVVVSAGLLDSASDLRIKVLEDKFPHRFAVGDLALLWDPAGGPCVLLEVTGLNPISNTEVELQHADKEPYNAGSPNFFATAKPGTGFGIATRVARLAPESRPRHFAVDPVNRRLMTWTTLSANPSTDKDATLEIVADQIEDMQLSWACDTDGDRTLLEGPVAGARQTDEWAFNVAGDTPPACADQPIGAARITLTGRSNSDVPGASLGGRPAAEDRAAGVPDRFSRTVLTTEVGPLNLWVR